MAAAIYKAHKPRREPPLLKTRRLGEKTTAVEFYFFLFHSIPLGHGLVLFIALVAVLRNLQCRGESLGADGRGGKAATKPSWGRCFSSLGACLDSSESLRLLGEAERTG